MPTTLHPTILHFDSIDSTNLEALRQARAGAAEGVCIIAREQTAGRGRLDRKWHSPRDAGLYLSIILRPRFPLTCWPLLTLMSAVAVVDALFKTAGISADIKWPNDIHVNEKKLCGILSETLETQAGPAVIVGIGVNLTCESVPPELASTATSLEHATEKRVSKDHLINELLRAIAERYEMLEADGGREHTIREWCANSSYALDRSVRVSLEGESFAGITRGVENDGALRIETADGTIR